MKINSINNNYQSQTNFKSLVFHDNARKIITKGDKEADKKVSTIANILSHAKDFDMHVKPLGKYDTIYFWTKKDGKNPVMEIGIRTYNLDTKGKNVGIYATNPYGYDDGDFCAVLQYEDESQAQKAIDAIDKRIDHKSQLDRLVQNARTTMWIEKAQKMMLKPFYCWNLVKKDMPQGDKFSYEYKTPVDTEERKETIKKATKEKLDEPQFVQRRSTAEASTLKPAKVHYGFSDRIRILFGLQPKNIK